MTGKAPNGARSTISGVIFFYVSGCKLRQTAPGLITCWQTSVMWCGWLNVTKYQGQHLIGDSLFFPSSVGKCQLDNAAVCHPSAHSPLIPPNGLGVLLSKMDKTSPDKTVLCYDARSG